LRSRALHLTTDQQPAAEPGKTVAPRRTLLTADPLQQVLPQSCAHTRVFLHPRILPAALSSPLRKTSLLPDSIRLQKSSFIVVPIVFPISLVHQTIFTLPLPTPLALIL
jgi:hypothetical protein